MFDINKPYRCRDGRNAVICAVLDPSTESHPLIGYYESTSGMQCSSSWDRRGRFDANNTRETHLDLVNYEPETFVYVNVFSDNDGKLYTTGSRPNRRDASLTGAGRIGCIKVKLEARFDD